MLIKKLGIGIGIGGLGVTMVIAASVAFGQKPADRPTNTLSQLQSACRRNIDEDGFGHATLSDTNIQNETGQLLESCKIRLRAGTTLQMNNVHLETKNLLIQDTGLVKRPSHIVINNSSIVSSSGGFQIKLEAAKSTVAVKNSLFSYLLSAGISVGQDDDNVQTSLEVTDSTFRSKATDSEGIVLVSTGTATFKRNRFELAAPNGKALLLGTHCVLGQNINANERCQGL